MKIKLASALPASVLQAPEPLRAALVHLNQVIERLSIGTFSEFDMRKQLGKVVDISKAALEWQQAEDLLDALRDGAGEQGQE